MRWCFLLGPFWGRGLESDSCSDSTRLARDGRQPARKKKSAVISFKNGTKKAEIYLRSQPELQKDEVVKGRSA
jgi:hypothetical protein